MTRNVVPLRMFGVASLHGNPVCMHSGERAVSVDTQVPLSEFGMTAPVLFCGLQKAQPAGIVYHRACVVPD